MVVAVVYRESARPLLLGYKPKDKGKRPWTRKGVHGLFILAPGIKMNYKDVIEKTLLTQKDKIS